MEMCLEEKEIKSGKKQATDTGRPKSSLGMEKRNLGQHREASTEV